MAYFSLSNTCLPNCGLTLYTQPTLLCLPVHRCWRTLLKPKQCISKGVFLVPFLSYSDDDTTCVNPPMLPPLPSRTATYVFFLPLVSRATALSKARSLRPTLGYGVRAPTFPIPFVPTGLRRSPSCSAAWRTADPFRAIHFPFTSYPVLSEIFSDISLEAVPHVLNHPASPDMPVPFTDRSRGDKTVADHIRRTRSDLFFGCMALEDSMFA